MQREGVVKRGGSDGERWWGEVVGRGGGGREGRER